MTALQRLSAQLRANDRRWLVTGVAGFIGSHLLEALLNADQIVRGIDNFATGHRDNLEAVRAKVSKARWANFEMVEGDIRDERLCETATANIGYVLHQAALGSVPRSLADPIATNATNISGFLNILEHARRHGVLRFVYAASSSTYGDSVELPKVEEHIGNPISPYAVTKRVNEIYADVYTRCFGMSAIGLRYFNVFGPRQDPNGPYAAVIPRWLAAMVEGENIWINGDGETSRDFCFVDNAVQANLAAALLCRPERAEVYNIAVGQQTSLIDLFKLLQATLVRHGIVYSREPIMMPERAGDVRHSLASIEKASTAFGYAASHDIVAGVERLVEWYVSDHPLVENGRERVLQ